MSNILVWHEDGVVLLDAAEGVNHANTPIYTLTARKARQIAIELLKAADEAEDELFQDATDIPLVSTCPDDIKD